MATVSYVTTANFGAMAALAAGKVQEAVADLGRIQAAGLAAAGSPFDATKLEGGDFGAAAGQGQAFYNAVSGLYAALTTSNATVFTNELDKGA